MRIGIDLGGTKIAGVVLDEADVEQASHRVATPAGDYAATLTAVTGLVRALESSVGAIDLPVGVAHPGAISPATGLIKNANSTCLNGRPLQIDLQQSLDRPVALANDANCLAASELFDGAARDVDSVFAAILGTGVGGAIAVNGQVLTGAHAIAGEWGHNPLPWPCASELPGPTCWCGRQGCIETWVSGVGLAADHRRHGGAALDGEKIVAAAESGDDGCLETLARYEQRLARALAHVINLFDPQVIVLGGGLSRVQRFYCNVPALWSSWIFSDVVTTRLVPARYGDASGARGAARLSQR